MEIFELFLVWIILLWGEYGESLNLENVTYKKAMEQKPS